MVDIIFFGSKDKPRALLIEGHADFSCYGMDVVCAEISLISQNILISLIKVLADKISYDVKNGFLAFDISNEIDEGKKKIAFKLIRILINALSLTEKSFPENLNISFLKVNSKEYKKFKKSFKKYKEKNSDTEKLLIKEKIEVSFKNNFLEIKGDVDIGNYKNGILNAAITAFIQMIKGSKDEFNLNLLENKTEKLYQLTIESNDKELYLLSDTIKEGLINLNKQYPNNLIFDEKEV